MAKSEVVTVRLTQKEVEALDRLTVGQLSRSQVIRIVLQEYLSRPEKAQRDFLKTRVFG